MATEPIRGGLSTDPSKVNLYGAREEDVSEYQKSLEDSIKALQQRYAQPNWFNVAAGFFKPQLGGFAASLGSASEALGQNVERERESQLPIAQMRTQLAMSKIAMGQNRAAADLVKEWEGRGSPPGEMPALAQKLESLGASGLAGGIKGKIDTMRANTASDQQALQIFYQKRAADVQAVQVQLAGRMITPAQAAAAMREINSRVPPASTIYTQIGESARPETQGAPIAVEKAASAVPAAADKESQAAAVVPQEATQPPATAAVTPSAQPPAAVAASKEKTKTRINPVINLNEETNYTQSQIDARAKLAVQYAQEGADIYKYLRSVAGPENYNQNITPIDNALKLLGYGEKDPNVRKALEEKANKVMNVLAGDEFNALLKALNTGIGLNIGPLTASLSAPIEAFVRAKFPKKTGLQDYALDLAQNFAQINLARQKLLNINPNAASNIELHASAESSPTMNSSPVSAMKNLMHLHTLFDQLRDMHNFISDVDTGKHAEYEVAPGNEITRIFDIARSDGYKKIASDYLKTHKAIEEARKK